MSKIAEYVPQKRLGDGESVEGLFDPQIDIPEVQGALGGVVHTILLKGNDGKPFTLEGGKGLMDGFYAASLSAPGKVVKVKVTAHGEARTTARKYDVKVVR